MNKPRYEWLPHGQLRDNKKHKWVIWWEERGIGVDDWVKENIVNLLNDLDRQIQEVLDYAASRQQERDAIAKHHPLPPLRGPTCAFPDRPNCIGCEVYAACLPRKTAADLEKKLEMLGETSCKK